MNSTRLHPLHNPDDLAQYMKDTGHIPDFQRGTGRTTVVALRALADAIGNPRTRIAVHDHHMGAKGFPTHAQNEEVARMALVLAKRLGLSHIHKIKDECAIIFGSEHVR